MLARSRAVLACTAAVLLLSAPGAGAGSERRSQIPRRPPPPRPGAWAIASGGTDDNNLSGSFTVGAGPLVSGLRGRIQRHAGPACARGTVAMIGTQRIFDAIGIDPQRSPYSEWVVGRNEPGTDPVIQPSPAQLLVAGRHVTGWIEIVFSSVRAESGGDIYYDAGNCDLNFLIRRR